MNSRKLSMTGLANALRISTITLKRWLYHGNPCKLPAAPMAEIAAHLRVDLLWLYYGQAKVCGADEAIHDALQFQHPLTQFLQHGERLRQELQNMREEVMTAAHTPVNVDERARETLQGQSLPNA